MESLYLLIPVSVALVFVIVGIFLWAVKSGQFDDMEGPAHRIIMDDDRPRPNKEDTEKEESPDGDAKQP